MDAIETLMSEHRLIERVIDALVAFSAESSRRDVVAAPDAAADKAELSRFVGFIREYADACHHGKEEDVLFAAMVDAGFPAHAGPVGVMLAEHREGRRLVGVLRELAERPTGWDVNDRQLLAEAATGYAELLRAHIHKEDAILYPMAEQRLAPAALEAVSARCAELDVANAQRQAGLAALGEALVSRWAPNARSAPSVPGPRVAFGGCC
jgi:hemerythrin-like domain-containing protein